MRISEYIDEDLVEPDLKGDSKEGVIRELSSLVSKKFPELNGEEIYNLLLERESLGSTGIGNGVAIPHGKLKNGERIYLAFGRSRRGVDFDAMDGKPVHLFFLLLAPESKPAVHLQALAKISRILKKSEVREKLMNASSAEEIVNVLREEDSKL